MRAVRYLKTYTVSEGVYDKLNYLTDEGRYSSHLSAIHLTVFVYVRR